MWRKGQVHTQRRSPPDNHQYKGPVAGVCLECLEAVWLEVRRVEQLGVVVEGHQDQIHEVWNLLYMGSWSLRQEAEAKLLTTE